LAISRHSHLAVSIPGLSDAKKAQIMRMHKSLETLPELWCRLGLEAGSRWAPGTVSVENEHIPGEGRAPLFPLFLHLMASLTQNATVTQRTGRVTESASHCSLLSLYTLLYCHCTYLAAHLLHFFIAYTLCNARSTIGQLFLSTGPLFLSLNVDIFGTEMTTTL
jgi:hypothetical protein